MATPKSPPTQPVSVKRRRKSGKGQGESSREASAGPSECSTFIELGDDQHEHALTLLALGRL